MRDVGTAYAHSVSRRQLVKSFGYLSYCSAVVFGGRAFSHHVRCLRYRPLPHAHSDSPFLMPSGWTCSGGWRTSLSSTTPVACLLWLHLMQSQRSKHLLMFEAVMVALACSLMGHLSDYSLSAAIPYGCPVRVPWGLTCPNWLASTVAYHELFAFIALLDLFCSYLANKVVRVFSDSVTAMRCSRDNCVSWIALFWRP